jgi:pyruvate/2-oxoglutarate dehydrogenase complex dihydrolipoamide dehydrogenase (E3) component
MARTELAGQGFVKLLFHRQKIIGACIVGAQADELIASLSLAVHKKMGKEAFQNWVKPHPTFSEIVNVRGPIT